MYRHLLNCFLLLSLSVGVEVEKESRPEVRVILSSGQEYEGEILAVRDHSIVFSTLHGASEGRLIQSRQAILILNHDDIREVLLIGDSNVLPGIAIGMGSGCMLGCLIGYSMEVSVPEEKSNKPLDCGPTKESKKEMNAMGGGLVGGLLGTVFGGAIGGSIREDTMIIGLQKRDFSILKLHARYGSEEPWFLRETELPLQPQHDD